MLNKKIAINLVKELIAKGLLNNLPTNVLSWSKNRTFSYNFHIGYGIYKYVFVLDDYNFVIKVDRKISAHKSVKEFQLYRQALREGMQEFFPETDFLISIGGHSFFIQEKASTDETKVVSNALDYFNSEQDALDYLYDERIEADDIINVLFPIEKAQKIIKWLDEQNIGDIHLGNVGFLNEHAVIIDFS